MGRPICASFGGAALLDGLNRFVFGRAILLAIAGFSLRTIRLRVVSFDQSAYEHSTSDRAHRRHDHFLSAVNSCDRRYSARSFAALVDA